MLRLRLRCTSDGAGDVETVPVAVLHAAGLRVARFPTPAHGDDAHPLLDGVLARMRAEVWGGGWRAESVESILKACVSGSLRYTSERPEKVFRCRALEFGLRSARSGENI